MTSMLGSGAAGLAGRMMVTLNYIHGESDSSTNTSPSLDEALDTFVIISFFSSFTF